MTGPIPRWREGERRLTFWLFKKIKYPFCVILWVVIDTENHTKVTFISNKNAMVWIFHNTSTIYMLIVKIQRLNKWSAAFFALYFFVFGMKVAWSLIVNYASLIPTDFVWSPQSWSWSRVIFLENTPCCLVGRQKAPRLFYKSIKVKVGLVNLNIRFIGLLVLQEPWYVPKERRRRRRQWLVCGMSCQFQSPLKKKWLEKVCHKRS